VLLVVVLAVVLLLLVTAISLAVVFVMKARVEQQTMVSVNKSSPAMEKNYPPAIDQNPQTPQTNPPEPFEYTDVYDVSVRPLLGDGSPDTGGS
jgi:hypothetical protein